MKNTKKAFTLVELIVVITILAVLATVAFISLTGYSQEAKNSKVQADLRSLVSAVETSMTKGEISVSSLTTDETNTEYDDNTLASGTFGSGITLNEGTNYNVGTPDFAALGQSGDDFVDADGNPYLAAYAAEGGTAYYQLVGQVKEASGDYTAVVKGNYVQEITTDVEGLFDATDFTGTGVTNKADLVTTGL